MFQLRFLSVVFLTLICSGFSTLSGASNRQELLPESRSERLQDGAGGGERCYGIPLGAGGWVLTNLHCLENSLLRAGLLKIKKMRSGVRYHALTLPAGTSFPVALPQVTFPEVPDGGDGRTPATEIWAAGAGYPLLSDVGGSPTSLKDWRNDAVEFPLEDFAILRVAGLLQDWSCLTTADFAARVPVLEASKVLMLHERLAHAGWATFSPGLPTPQSGAPDRFPFFVYAADSGLFFSDLPTQPGWSGLPVFNKFGEVVALHSFGIGRPATSAEIPLPRIGEVLNQRFPKVVGSVNAGRPDCRPAASTASAPYPGIK